MKKIIKTHFYITVFLTMASACSRESFISSQKIELGGVEIATQQSLKLALTVVTDLKTNLLAEGMSESSADAIKAGALSGLHFGGLSLAQDNPYQLHLAVPRIIGGAIKAMKDPAARLAEGPQKLQYSGIMTKAVFSSMESKMGSLSAKDRESLPGNISNSAVSNLADAGLTGADLAAGVGKVVDSAVSNLAKNGYQSTELLSVIKNISKSAVKGMSNIKLSKSAVGGAMNSLIKSTVGALGRAGVKSQDVGSFVGPIMSESVGGLKDLGLSGVSQMQKVVGNLMGSAVSVLGDAGVTDVSQVSGILSNGVKGAMEGMGIAGVTANKMPYFLDDMMKGAVNSLGTAGFKDSKQIQSLSATMASDTISWFDDFGINDQAALKTASNAVASGLMLGLGDLSDSGVIDHAAVKTASSQIASKAVDALYSQSKGLGIEGQITDVASGFTTGMVAGLSEAGWNSTKISSVSADISSGFKEALSDEEGMDESTLTSATSAIETSTSSWISEMKVHCLQEKGVWHEADGWCEFPLAAPVEGATAPNPEEEEGCFNDGGSVLFLPDGSWFCDIAAGESESLGTPEDCLKRGYTWINGPHGEFCETGTSPSECWAAIDSADCSTNLTCTWTGQYCEEATLMSCPKYSDKDSCLDQVQCFWDNVLASCVKNSCTPQSLDPQCLAPDIDVTGFPQGVTSTVNLDVTIGGPLISSYKYKIRDDDDTLCDDAAGYSPEFSAASHLVTNFETKKDGLIELCIIVRDTSSKWTPYHDALVFSWQKHTVAPPSAFNLDWIGGTYSQSMTIYPDWEISPIENIDSQVLIIFKDPFCSIPYGPPIDLAPEIDSHAVTVSQDGIYHFTIDTIDTAGNLGMSPCSIGLNVVSNASGPVLAPIADQSVMIGQSIIQINADDIMGGDYDQDGTPLAFSCRYDNNPDNIVAGPDCSTLQGANFDTALGIFNWTPSVSQAGIMEFEIVASDGSLSDFRKFLITVSHDTPLISYVSSGENPGTYSVGDPIIIDVTFSDPVNVVGSPKLWLETGPVDREAYYLTGSGTDTLSFQYVVQALDQSGNLDYQSSNALDLSGGTIDSVTGNIAADITLPPPASTYSLGMNAALQIDGVPPTLPSTISVSAFASTPSIAINYIPSSDPDYDYTEISACSSAACTAGCTAGIISYSSTDTLSGLPDGSTYYACARSYDLSGNFSDWVSSPSPFTIDLTSPTSPSSLAFNESSPFGGTGFNINFSEATDANFSTHKATACSDSGCSTGCSPEVSSATSPIGIGSLSSGTYYGCIKAIDQADNESPWIATGTPIVLDNQNPDPPMGVSIDESSPWGSSTITVTYAAGTDTNFATHNVKACTDMACTTSCIGDHVDPTSTSTIAGLSEGSFYACLQSVDTAGNTSSWVASSGSITIDMTAPTPPSALSIPEGTTHSGSGFSINFTLSTDPQINTYHAKACTSNDCTTGCSGSFNSPSSPVNLTGFSDGTFYGCLKAEDNAGNFSSYIAAPSSITLDSSPPTSPTGVAISESSPFNGSTISVVFTNGSDANLYTHNIKACSNTGCTTSCMNLHQDAASPASISGLTDGSYYACVQAEDTAGNTSSYMASSSPIIIDTSAPIAVNISSSNTNGHYKGGDLITVHIDFSEQIVVAGTPRLYLNSGAYAYYSSGSGGTTLIFQYTVAGGNNSSLLDYVSTTSLDFNGGTITDLAGNSINLILPTPGGSSSLGNNKSIIIDTVTPTPVIVDAPPMTGTSPISVSFTGGSDAHFFEVEAKACTSNDCATGCTAFETGDSSPTDIKASLTVSNSYYLCVKAKDYAGNVTSYSVSSSAITIDSLWGSGTHGAVTITANTDTSDATVISGRTFSHSARVVSKTGSAPSVSLTLSTVYTDNDHFAVGDEIGWIVVAAGSASSCTSDRGKYGLAEVTAISGGAGVLTINKDIPINLNGDTYTYGGGFCMVQVFRIPHFTNLTINSGMSLTATTFNSANGSGGIVAFRANVLNLDGTISTLGRGFQTIAINNTGGSGIFGPGGGASQAYGNGGEKGSYTGGSSAGGGGYGAGGDSSNGYAGGAAITECSSLCTPDKRLFFGGSGGRSGTGLGHGGGIILIFADTITGTGTISASGGDGGSDAWTGDGGGAGGYISITVNDPSSSFTIHSEGGTGGNASHNGGGGGGGAMLTRFCSANSFSASQSNAGGSASGSADPGSNGYAGAIYADYTCPP